MVLGRHRSVGDDGEQPHQGENRTFFQKSFRRFVKDLSEQAVSLRGLDLFWRPWVAQGTDFKNSTTKNKTINDDAHVVGKASQRDDPKAAIFGIATAVCASVVRL